MDAMLDETVTIESDVERVRSQRASLVNERSGSKPRRKKPATKAEISQPREIILRLIELFKQA